MFKGNHGIFLSSFVYFLEINKKILRRYLNTFIINVIRPSI